MFHKKNHEGVGARRRWAHALLAMLAWGLVAGVSAAGAADAPAPVDLNRATVEQLEALPGIGSSKAAAIVAQRTAQGGFASVDELESVRGIGPALVSKLRPLVRVDARKPAAPKAASKR